MKKIQNTKLHQIFERVLKILENLEEKKNLFCMAKKHRSVGSVGRFKSKGGGGEGGGRLSSKVRARVLVIEAVGGAWRGHIFRSLPTSMI